MFIQNKTIQKVRFLKLLKEKLYRNSWSEIKCSDHVHPFTEILEKATRDPNPILPMAMTSKHTFVNTVQAMYLKALKIQAWET